MSYNLQVTISHEFFFFIQYYFHTFQIVFIFPLLQRQQFYYKLNLEVFLSNNNFLLLFHK